MSAAQIEGGCRDSQDVRVVHGITPVRQWESESEQLAASDSSGLVSITSAGRIDVSCGPFPTGLKW